MLFPPPLPLPPSPPSPFPPSCGSALQRTCASQRAPQNGQSIHLVVGRPILREPCGRIWEEFG
eukprot:7570353-Pyramimonas_sp.AAC.1